MVYINSTWHEDPRDVSQLAMTIAPERRVANDGDAYTAEEFEQHYGHHWESMWADCAHTTDASQLVPLHDDVASSLQPSIAPGATDVQAPLESQARGFTHGHGEGHSSNLSQLAVVAGNVSQLAADAVRLDPSMVIGVRQQEAARGPPRALHKLARDALNQVSQNPTYHEENLDNLFDWIPYVAAHARCDQIIGPGITHAVARFVQGTRDANRGGAPRLDFCFYRVDGSMCRVHPGNKPKNDAQLIIQQL